MANMEISMKMEYSTYPPLVLMGIHSADAGMQSAESCHHRETGTPFCFC